jgi:hypothetical protein
MPIPSIRITSLTDAGQAQDHDLIHFQRQVLGVWTDYYTDFATLYGAAQTTIIEWDMSASLAETIAPQTPGNLLVFLGASAVFMPGSITPGTGNSILIYNTGRSGFAQYHLPFIIGADSYAIISAPFDDPSTEIYDGLATDLAVELTVAPGAFDSTMRIIVQYAEVTPV